MFSATSIQDVNSRIKHTTSLSSLNIALPREAPFRMKHSSTLLMEKSRSTLQRCRSFSVATIKGGSSRRKEMAPVRRRNEGMMVM